MGTESQNGIPPHRHHVRLVKLNNPLMGTESFRLQLHPYCRIVGVKLNNPLMGTEIL